MTVMFYHVVLMRLTDADDGFLARVSDFGERIRLELPYVLDYQFGRNVAFRAKGYDWTVIGTFENSADHDRYQISPVHQGIHDAAYRRYRRLRFRCSGRPLK